MQGSIVCSQFGALENHPTGCARSPLAPTHQCTEKDQHLRNKHNTNKAPTSCCNNDSQLYHQRLCNNANRGRGRTYARTWASLRGTSVLVCPERVSERREGGRDTQERTERETALLNHIFLNWWPVFQFPLTNKNLPSCEDTPHIHTHTHLLTFLPSPFIFSL